MSGEQKNDTFHFSFKMVNDSDYNDSIMADSIGHGPPDIINSVAVQTLFYLLYTIIFILGVFGNVLVCYVVGRNRAMQTVTNFFITNLALSDILLCVLSVPFTPLNTFLQQWIFGSLLCHLVAYAQGSSVYISTWTLTSIAIDRFFVIIYPFKPRMKLSTCLFIIVTIWTFALFATLPYCIFIEHTKYEGSYYCSENWPSEKIRQLFGGFTAVMQFFIPFIIIAICYVKVSLKLSDRAKAKPGAKSSRKEEADRERKRRTNRMLIAMVTIFGMSWLPLNVVNFLNDVKPEAGEWKYYNLCFFMAHAIAMSSTCYNPFLYAWLNENFRKEFKQVLPCFDTKPTAKGRASAWKSERTCNGNETMQESLLTTQTTSTSTNSMRRHTTTTCITTTPPLEEVEENSSSFQGQVTEVPQAAPLVVYSAQNDSVQLHMDDQI